MRTINDAKAMAKTLRAELAGRQFGLSHGECLDIVAKQFGVDNWNILSAHLAAGDGKPLTGTRLTMPDGWTITGQGCHLYEAGIDPAVRSPSGGFVATIRPRRRSQGVEAEAGFATLMQSVAADAFRGQRVRFRALLRTEAVVDAATIWLRIEGEQKQVLAFDNLLHAGIGRALVGTHDWTERKIVLDVPEKAESLHFGFLLQSAGTVWGTDFSLSQADETEVPTRSRFHTKPVNLNFAGAA